MKDKFPEQVLKVALYDICECASFTKLCFYYNDAYPEEDVMRGENKDTPKTSSRKTFMKILDGALSLKESVLLSITTTVICPNGGVADFGTMNRQRKAVHNYLTKRNYKIQPTDSSWLLLLSKKDVGEIVLEEI